MVKYAKEEVDGIVEKARKDKQAKLKAMIKNSVTIDKRQAILAS
jgi:hypothetical protein